MLKRIKSLLTSGPSSEPPTEHERIQVATAALLLEMAHADEEFREMEQQIIRDLLQRRFELSEDAAGELMELAQEKRKESLDLFHFAREINRDFTPEEKLEVMEVLWRVVYADGVLDKYEDYLIRKLASLLRLSHRQMIEAKLKVLGELRE